MGVGLKDLVAEAQSKVRQVSPAEVKEGIDRGEIDLVLDVREPGEFKQGHLPGALNVPRGLLELKADAASPVADPALVGRQDAQIVTYCLKAPGARSLFAAETLMKMGFSNVAAMSAGSNGWSEEGLPLET
jgi:rhodanese-related sulfurtransferase